MSGQQRPGGAGSRVTIGDVARHAGVSATTVSHVLSGKRLVGSATKERVAEAIQELGYRPNSAARQLRTKRSGAVAVLVPDISTPYYSVLTRGVTDAVGGGEYGTYVCNTDGSLERERVFLHDVLDRGVDGIVMASSANMPKDRDLTPTRFGPPVVCIGDDYLELDVDFVTTADRAGARAATAHLLARGAGRVAMIQGPSDGGMERTLGYVDALNAAGQEADPSLQVHGDGTRPSGRAAMRTLIARQPRPDAVFCANDLMAIGAMDAIHELRLRVPEDVALVGFDDVDAATIVTPALTTVRNPAYDIGHEAGQLLLSRMRGAYSGPSRTVSLKCVLVERESG